MADNLAIEAVVKHLSHTHDCIQDYSQTNLPAAQALQAECVKLIKELLDALEKLRVRGHSKQMDEFSKSTKRCALPRPRLSSGYDG